MGDTIHEYDSLDLVGNILLVGNEYREEKKEKLKVEKQREEEVKKESKNDVYIDDLINCINQNSEVKASIKQEEKSIKPKVERMDPSKLMMDLLLIGDPVTHLTKLGLKSKPLRPLKKGAALLLDLYDDQLALGLRTISNKILKMKNSKNEFIAFIGDVAGVVKSGWD